MTAFPLLSAQGLILMSWWAPMVVALVFAGWAWVVSSVYDKDAARFYLPRRRWNLIHLTAGGGALAVIAVAPLPHSLSIPVGVVLLAADLAAYFLVRNADDRVPAEQKWTLDIERIKQQLQARKKKQIAAGVAMVFKGPAGELPPPPKNTAEHEVRVEAEALLQRLADQRGTQLEIGPLKDGTYGVMAVVDGVRQPLTTAPLAAARAVAIINLYKAAAGLDLQDRRRRLQGDFRLGPANTGPVTTARVTTMGSAAGMQLTLVLDPEGQVSRTLETLGLHPNQRADLQKILDERKGVVLVAAPPHSGRTTTLYTLIRAHDAYTSNVQTVELEPQMTIEGVRQNRFDPKVDGAEYSTTVRSILRRDPDVVGIAEMPDDDTAKQVAAADHDRTRTYLALPADGTYTAIQAYARAVGDQNTAARSLHGVVAERLVRKLCENCRVAFQPTQDVLKKLGLPPETKQLFRKGGQVLIKDKPVTCPVCGGSGFFGQVGVFEVHPIGPEERQLIAQNDMTGLKAMFRQKKQQSLQQSALMHAIAGATSVEEVIRILQPPPAARSTPPPAAQPAGPKTAGS